MGSVVGLELKTGETQDVGVGAAGGGCEGDVESCGVLGELERGGGAEEFDAGDGFAGESC